MIVEVVQGDNDLATTDPGLVPFWDKTRNPKNISEYHRGSTYKAWWICANQHSYQMMVRFKAQRNQNCPFCSNKKVWPGYNDLATLRPDLLVSWSKDNTIRPSEVTPGSGKIVEWVCDLGHRWSAKVSARVNHGCQRCSGLERWNLSEAERRLTSRYPEIIKMWDYNLNDVSPESLTSSSKGVFWFKCASHGRSYQYSSRGIVKKSKNFCGCAGSVITRGDTDSVLDIELLSSAWSWHRNSVDPSEVFSASERKHWFRCIDGHDVNISPFVVTKLGRVPCGMCSGQVVIAGINDLSSVYPEVAARWDAARNQCPPDSVYFSSNVKYWFTCVEGHAYRQYVYREISGDFECRKCSGRTLVEGVNDLQTLFPKIAEELVGDPRKIKASSHTKVDWRCIRGHEWSTSVYHRTYNKSRCPSCWTTSSRIEIALYESLLLDRRFSSTVSGPVLTIPWRERSSMSIDILTTVGSRSLAVEYDGQYWHKDRYDVDTAKTSALLNAGHYVVRVREEKLNLLEIDDAGLLQISVPPMRHGEDLTSLVDHIHSWATN